MPNNFCRNCGAALVPNAYACSRCGTPVNNQPIYVVKQKTPGKGFGITSMIMGIIGLVYTAALFSNIINAIDQLSKYHYFSHNSFISSFVSLGVIVSIFAVLAIIFAICAFSRKFMNGIAKSGLLMGMVSLALNISLVIAVVVVVS